MKMIFCGGGTAGHITPALAIAKELKRIDPQNEILFIGRDGGMENDLIKKAGFCYKTISVSGIKRNFTLKNIEAIYKAIKAKRTAKKIIADFSPDAILGTGGYVCYPIICAGYDMKIPTYIHESNIFPGLTTRMLSKKCNRVFLSSEEAKRYLKNKNNLSVVGNPARKEFFTISKRDARNKLNLSEKEIFILSFGGSLGAKKINEITIAFMENYSSKKESIRHLHATGKGNYKKEYDTLFKEKSGCKIVPFLENIATYMKAADVVICRAGAMTISELAASGAPAILIPSPNVADNHQMKNALALAEKNAAIVLCEDDLTEENLTEKIDLLTSDRRELLRMSKCISLFAKKDVVGKILEEISTAVKQRQNMTR